MCLSLSLNFSFPRDVEKQRERNNKVYRSYGKLDIDNGIKKSAIVVRGANTSKLQAKHSRGASIFFSNLLQYEIVPGKKKQVDGCTDKQEQLHEFGKGGRACVIVHTSANTQEEGTQVGLRMQTDVVLES